MKKNWLLLITSLVFILISSVHATQGRIIGEEEYDLPSWFKTSFLEIQEDVQEANDLNKNIMLFMHIDRCAYCTRMLEENFIEGKNKTFIQKHFEVIALNIRGDREIYWDKNTKFREKDLAKRLKVMATPAIIFLNSKGEKVYQMNGYRKPEEFRQVLSYINGKHYKRLKLFDYLAQKNEHNYTFKSNPLFTSMTDFSKYKGPMAILFEDKSCLECDEFHKEVLMHKDVMKELQSIKMIRLDAHSSAQIIDPRGIRTTAKEWAKALDMDYRPGTVFFNEGKEITRLEGRIYHFHYKELLRYVSGGYYKQYQGFTSYLDKRVKALLKSGVDVDVGK